MTMYLEHFGLSEAPFKITPHTEFFFAGANRGETLEALLYAITSGEGMVKVTGEVGAGKTMLCRVLMERLPETVETIYLAVPSLSRDEMLAVIAGDLGLDIQGGNTTKLVRALQERLIQIHGEGKQVVALIDEAHAMPLETLEEIRLLSNLETSHDKLMQIVLFGQPELDEHLSLPNMRQLKERITHSFNLLPMPPLAIRAYLDFRLRAAGYKGPYLFGAEALKLIAEASEGLTRRINIYADKTLLAAFAAGTHTVTPDHVRAAISDTQIVLPAKNNRGAVNAWVALAALLIGIAIGFVLGRETAPVPTPVVINKIAPPAAKPADTLAPATAAPVEAAKAEPAPAAAPGKDEPKMVTGKITGSLSSPTAPATTSAATSAAAPVAMVEPVAKTPKDWLAARMEVDVQRLQALPGDRYAIQLMTADQREKSAIESFLRVVSKELNPDRIMVYPSGTSDNPKVSVLYSNYTERADANGELAQLSPKLTQFRPYVRSVSAIRDDIRP